MDGAFLPILALALVSCGLGVLAGRHLWPRIVEVPAGAGADPDEAADDEAFGPKGLEPALSDLEQRLRESEAELEQVRTAIGRRPPPRNR